MVDGGSIPRAMSEELSPHSLMVESVSVECHPSACGPCSDDGASTFVGKIASNVCAWRQDFGPDVEVTALGGMSPRVVPFGELVSG
jgi:hypothetical protein